LLKNHLEKKRSNITIEILAENICAASAVFQYFDLERSEVYKTAVFAADLTVLAYTKGLFYYSYTANKFHFNY